MLRWQTFAHCSVTLRCLWFVLSRTSRTYEPPVYFTEAKILSPGETANGSPLGLCGPSNISQNAKYVTGAFKEHFTNVPACSTVPFPKPSSPIQNETRALGTGQLTAGCVQFALTYVNVAPLSTYPDHVLACVGVVAAGATPYVENIKAASEARTV